MRENVNIVLTEDADYDEARSELVEKGLEVKSDLRDLGAVLGTVDSALVPALRSLDGVLAVETETTVSVPPIPEDGDTPTFRAPADAPDGEVHITTTDEPEGPS